MIPTAVIVLLTTGAAFLLGAGLGYHAACQDHETSTHTTTGDPR